MAVFEWNQFNSSYAKISRYVQGFRCRTTNIVAYYIPNKHNLNIDFEFDGEFEPLRNNYGIYFLMGDSGVEGEKPTIYIGQASTREGSKGMDRLREHVDMTTDWYKDKWDTALYVTSTDNSWSTSLIDTLERLFIACFRTHADYTCLNSKRGKDGNIPERDFKTELLAISELIALPMFGYTINKDTKSNIINSVYDKLVEMAVDIREEVKEELKAEYLKKYDPEDRQRIEWVKQAEAYDNFKSSIELANNNIVFGRILGGMKGEVITPDVIAKQMVDMLDPEIFNSKTKFLDIACKSGIYLKCLIDKYMSDDEALPINHETDYANKMVRLKHLINNQIYAMCLSRNGYLVSNRMLIEAIEQYQREYTSKHFAFGILDSITILPNITYIHGYDSLVKNEPATAFKLIQERFLDKTELEEGKTLKFDVVIGNPPYNNDIYIDFVELGHKLADKCSCWITPAKWQAKGGGRNESFRKNIVPYMSKIVFYPCAQEVFDIRNLDGISYYLIADSKSDIKTIVNKSDRVRAFNNEIYRSIDGQLNNIAAVICNKISGDKYKFEKLDTSYFGLKEGDSGDLTGRYSVVKANSEIGRIDSVAKNYDKISQYKVVMQRVLGNSYYGNDGMTIALNKMYIEEPNTVTVANYIGLYHSHNRLECESFVSYFDTRVIRFLCLVALVGQGGTDLEFWRYIPDPGAFDHIFTDQELYEKYNLTDDEIAIIESIIKARK